MKHRAWNNDWVDNTWRPITPPLESATNSSFRTAIAELLPTPPASVSDEGEGDAMSLAEKTPKPDENKSNNIPIRYASPPIEIYTPPPSYRKRYGRGGRLFVDRRGLKRPLMSPSEEDEAMDERKRERQEYDVDSDEEPQIYISDPHDYWNTKFRIHFSSGGRDPAIQQKMLEEAQRRQQAQASANATANSAAAVSARGALPAPQAQMQR